MTSKAKPKLILDHLHFGEGPRVRGDHLWFSDMHGHRVQRLNLRYLNAGEAAEAVLETVVQLDAPCSGLGWLPDGDLLIVEMEARRLLRWNGGTLTVHAELGDYASWHCNDMVVTDDGTAYVGNFGFDLHTGATPKGAELLKVSPAGAVAVVAEDLNFPNGAVITPDASTLIVAETFGRRLTAFTIEDEGTLSYRRSWAELPQGAVPDGICYDAAHGIWAASPTTNEVLRLVEGGTITHRIETDRSAIACMLAEHTLYILTAEETDPAFCEANRSAQLVAHPAPYPGAGWP